MSLKTLLMPAISQHLLSHERLLRRRDKFERRRMASGSKHQLDYFHQVDDPYSALVAYGLPRLVERYDIDLRVHIVDPPVEAAAPDRQRLISYSRQDAHRLAQHLGLDFIDPGAQPTAAAIAQATELMVTAAEAGCFVEVAAAITGLLWRSPDKLADFALPASPGGPVSVRKHIASANRRRRRDGHYLGATFHYGGEWYWGIDRLHYLESRLQSLGVSRDPDASVPSIPDADLSATGRLDNSPPIDFFFSFRSPYSAIVAPRVFDMAKRIGADVRVRPVLPMVMRGLVVPSEKRRYIALDAAREARRYGIPFGRINDPLGRPTERAMAIMPVAERENKVAAFVLSFARGVWAQGINAGSDAGLRQIVERAGLDWSAARTAMTDEGWRDTAEKNRSDLLALGLWGVPSFRVRDVAVWGQDRLWLIQDELLRGHQ